MKILLCHERFIFRFGVDRVLIILGHELIKRGYTIDIIGNRFDKEIVSSFADNIIEIKEKGEYINQNEYTQEWLSDHWGEYYSYETKPDIVLVAGWPFFKSISFFRRMGCNVVFHDYGLVPFDGFDENILRNLNKIKFMRKNNLHYSSRVLGISNFITKTQSIRDVPKNVECKTIYLGADHLSLGIWKKEILQENDNRETCTISGENIDKKVKKIILLGRWETGCYKNAGESYEFVDKLSGKNGEFVFYVLADKSEIDYSKPNSDKIMPLGFPDDYELLETMKNCDLAVTFSKWEGFNLPLAEMQWEKKPILVYNVAAHPEVVFHPWFLCSDLDNMIEKTILIFDGKGLSEEEKEKAYQAFHKKFNWTSIVGHYEKEFTGMVKESIDERLSKKPLKVIIDVTNSSHDPANPGIIRVTRGLSRILQSNIEPVFVIWSNEMNTFVFPTGEEYKILSSYNGPEYKDYMQVSTSHEERTYLADHLDSLAGKAWLLFPEILDFNKANKVKKFIKQNGLKSAAIFYDSIAILYPEYTDTGISENHGKYMIQLSGFDLVISISDFSKICLNDYWKDGKITTAAEKNVSLLLPGEFGEYSREKKSGELGETIKILCVSTLEPRKNHMKLVKAFIKVIKRDNSRKYELILVGNRYMNDDDIPEFIEGKTRKYNNIKWLGVVSDDKLDELYRKTTFTVYPSIAEGFGMPIMESIWYGKPCVCNNWGVMSELAKGGGCLTVNVKNEDQLSEAIFKLSNSSDLYDKLAKEAIGRPVKNWEEYGTQFITILLDTQDIIQPQISQTNNEHKVIKKFDIDQELYPECHLEQWQMNHSERLAIQGLLSKIKPICCVEVGTYKAGSLSLISQYSKMVFSIDIDPSIPEKYNLYENVKYLTGDSSKILPLLFEELYKSGIAIDFLIIDGDHSREGVRRDLECVLNYRPLKKMYVMMHDSFNPDCRQGMMEVDWNRSPFVHFVDLDFIPGRLTEEGAAEVELWGGLGLFIMDSEIRNEPLQFAPSCENMQRFLSESTIKIS